MLVSLIALIGKMEMYASGFDRSIPVLRLSLERADLYSNRSITGPLLRDA